MYDLAIIGGGINGVGIARDAAGRGLKVLLVEKEDLAAHTSSASTKLIHGGLRYLEMYEFALVRKALKEREVLLRAAPHIIWPLQFILPVDKGMRPAWFLRLGLFLYDHLGGRKLLPATKSVDLRNDPRGKPLQERLKKAFAYADCWVEDARLVSLSARDAAERGADVRTRCECVGLERHADHWQLRLIGHGGEVQVTAKALVNAAGPWVDRVSALGSDSQNAPRVRLVKGSHIVVRKLFEGNHAYIFQNKDGRIIFAIPYERHFTLIGTTDQPWSFDEGEAAISDEEIHYLCAAASEYFTVPVTPEQVEWTYAGVRPLFDDQSDDPSKVTRDYVLDLDETGGAPVMTVYGGKITTYRELALDALRRLAPALGSSKKDWTGDATLPGGDFAPSGFGSLVEKYNRSWPMLEPATMRRLVRAYGTDVADMLADVSDRDALGQHFGAGLYEVELRWLIEKEFASAAEDVLWRRSKLGLHMSDEERQAVADWFMARDTA